MNETHEHDEAQAATACNCGNIFNGELLTLKEVAQVLKVSRKTLYTWKSQGKIRFVKIAGSLIRIPRADLTALITRDDTPAA